MGRVIDAPQGERLLAYNPRGVLCGVVNLKDDGEYSSFLHVYVDDPGTEADEGLRRGDRITFRIGDREVSPVGEDEFVYDGTWGNIYEIELGG